MDTSHLAKPVRSTTVSYFPTNTVRCEGPAVFRSQLARDIACILDVDENVISWACQSTVIQYDGVHHRPDLTVVRNEGIVLIDALPRTGERPPIWASDAARRAGYDYRAIERAELPPIRLKNARDLLRYAKFEATLADRIRLLAALDDHGSLTVAECLSAFQNHPIPSLASLLLQRFIVIDLDEQLIGPESQVRRRRN
ncbi:MULTISPECIES: hypothetical protein [unclassified Ensifer]|uniref:hypothetical protein n=1 Tax=unclassified Ensifer TaxID=2633371 RepID=UPI000812E36B|nr:MULTISPECIES: hypothetical protein [unclassified Ensifer]OCP19676.1 hypothetical protein BC361_30190 [Ensifer sp. LC54]OCP19706.1 hypothetical protein BC363_30490 [Ensifer sp. LC384]